MKRIVLVLFLSLLTGFPVGSQSAECSEALPRMVVVPFTAVRSEGGTGKTVRCPLSGMLVSGGEIAEGAEQKVEAFFIDKVKEQASVERLSSEKVRGVYQKVSSEQQKKSLLEVLRRTGQEKGAKFVAAGFLYRYVERVGYGFSSKKPASVAFEIHLLRVNDGKVIWTGFFDKTQKSLMENVFEISSFFKGGAKWLTAEELTQLGMDDVFESFPDLQD